MKNKYDIVIIGAGLGGLLSANILCQEGLKVCIVEQNKRIGGSIQSFSKNKIIFNTGLNYTESLGEGEVLNQYFKYFKIMDKLKTKRLDLASFNKISFGNDDTEYPLAQGKENFVNKLSEYFPKSKESLKSYIDTLDKICNSFPLYTLNSSNKSTVSTDILHLSTYEYIKSISPDNNKLQQVLAGMNPLYGAVKEKTPLYVHALITYSFIKSSWRLIDGGSQLATAIATIIKQNGGEIFCQQKVVSIGGEEKKAHYVEMENGARIYASKIISNVHPATTLKLVTPEISKKIYTYRINSLENTIGMFTMYISLKENSFPYLNYNHHYYTNENAWTANYDPKSWPEHYFLYTSAISKSDKWANSLVVMTYMKYSEVEKWKNTTVEKRGEEYLEFKHQKAELLLNSVEKKFPTIRENIVDYYTSTPLTYRDYTGTYNGSSYGILKDYNDPLSTIITPKSRITNLFFTGQNLNLHGILGVTIGAVDTCSQILGHEYLLNKILDAK
jgi:all-trans-retinol 13,14-reductase